MFCILRRLNLKNVYKTGYITNEVNYKIKFLKIILNFCWIARYDIGFLILDTGLISIILYINKKAQMLFFGIRAFVP